VDLGDWCFLAQASRRIAATISSPPSLDDAKASPRCVGFELVAAHPPRKPDESSRDERKETRRHDAGASWRSGDDAIVDGSFVRRRAQKAPVT
jgi:hypothetical protein